MSGHTYFISWGNLHKLSISFLLPVLYCLLESLREILLRMANGDTVTRGSATPPRKFRPRISLIVKVIKDVERDTPNVHNVPRKGQYQYRLLISDFLIKDFPWLFLHSFFPPTIRIR